MSRRVLVVGTGSIGLRHMRLLSECADLEIEICDTRPEGLAEAANVNSNARQWTDYRDALESHPDIVIVATPPRSHGTITEAALASGAHVFCEKPMADSFDAARSMAAAQRSTGRLLNIGFVQRFMPELIYVRQLIRDDVIGSVCSARFFVATLSTLEASRSRHQHDVYAAAALDYVYGFDTFWWMLGWHPTSVYARGIHVENMPLESNPNVISAVVGYDGSCLGEVHIDYIAQPDRCSYTFQGTLGYLEVDMLSHSLIHGDRASRQVFKKDFTYERDEIMRAQRDHFLAAVEGKHGLSTPADDALYSAAAVDMLIRSLQSNASEPGPTIDTI